MNKSKLQLVVVQVTLLRETCLWEPCSSIRTSMQSGSAIFCSYRQRGVHKHMRNLLPFVFFWHDVEKSLDVTLRNLWMWHWEIFGCYGEKSLDMMSKNILTWVLLFVTQKYAKILQYFAQINYKMKDSCRVEPRLMDTPQQQTPTIQQTIVKVPTVLPYPSILKQFLKSVFVVPIVWKQYLTTQM